MNLEKDISPTGLYNYLPKLGTPRQSRRARVVKKRRPSKVTRRRRLTRSRKAKKSS